MRLGFCTGGSASGIGVSCIFDGIWLMGWNAGGGV